MLDDLKMIHSRDAQDALGTVARRLHNDTYPELRIADLLPEVPTSRNPAKQLSQELMGRSVVICAGPLLAPAARSWKISINRYAKQLAWVGRSPDTDLDEFVGWSGQPTAKPYAVIELRSNLETERVQRSFVVSERLLSGLRPTPLIVEPQGGTLQQQLLWSQVYGDFVSIYLALLNGLNPSATDLADKYKQAMEV